MYSNRKQLLQITIFHNIAVFTVFMTKKKLLNSSVHYNVVVFKNMLYFCFTVLFINI